MLLAQQVSFNPSIENFQMSHTPITIQDVVATLTPLKDIPRPEGDNEGQAINSPAIFERLSPEHQALVSQAEDTVSNYVRKPSDMGEEANRRSLTELNKHGFQANLNRDQYDPTRLVGSVTVDEWKLDLSDPENGDSE